MNVLKGMDVKTKAIILGVTGVFLLAMLLIFNPFYIIGPGQRGVLMDWGAVQPGVMEPGIHLVVPIYQSVVKINVRVQNFTHAETAASKDLQDVTTSVAVNYHIDPTDANYVFQNIGQRMTVETKIIMPAISNAVKAVTAHYNAEELITYRDRVKAEVQAHIVKALTAFKIEVDAVNITNFKFSKQFETAIEEKQVAQQKALQAQYELQKAQVKAKQIVVTARADAEAMRLKQTAVTRKIIMLDAVKKWNGVFPTYMVGNAPLPFLNVTAATQGK